MHGGIISNSNIRVTNGTLKSTVDVQAKAGLHRHDRQHAAGRLQPAQRARGTRTTRRDDDGAHVPYRAGHATASCPGKVSTFQPGYYDDADALSA